MMPDQIDDLFTPLDEDATRHQSFVLRCWRDTSGEVRVRLVDVRSGRSYSLSSIKEIPALVQRLAGEDDPALNHETG
jgi:hypothetical protein